MTRPPTASPEVEGTGGELVLGLSLFLATDRMLLHSSFVEALDPELRFVAWSRATSERAVAGQRNAEALQPFPAYRPLPHWMTVMRHFVDFSWDHAGITFTRPNFWDLRKCQEVPGRTRLTRRAARLTGNTRAAGRVEAVAQWLISRFGVQRDLHNHLLRLRPAMVFNLTPFHSHTLPIVVAARRAGIPVIAFMTSFDNLSTKGRMGVPYDGYVVWSDAMRDELRRLYPSQVHAPIRVVGAPQFDVFFNPRYSLSKQAFFRGIGLDCDRPVIVYCFGSPNLVREDFGALELLERRRVDPALQRCQIVVRTHPGYPDEGYSQLREIAHRFPDVVIQSNHQRWSAIPVQDDASTVEWVNTMRHADVVINLSSTVALDASICDRPVVNLDFDPEPGRPNDALVKAVNRSWDHFHGIAQSGAVALVSSMDELVHALRRYLENPTLDREARARIVDQVCGPTDGEAGARMAHAVEFFLERCGQSASTERERVTPAS